VRFRLHFLHYFFGDGRFVFSSIRYSDFRCIWVTLSCLATWVFVKKTKNL